MNRTYLLVVVAVVVAYLVVTLNSTILAMACDAIAKL